MKINRLAVTLLSSGRGVVSAHAPSRALVSRALKPLADFVSSSRFSAGLPKGFGRVPDAEKAAEPSAAAEDSASAADAETGTKTATGGGGPKKTPKKGGSSSPEDGPDPLALFALSVGMGLVTYWLAFSGAVPGTEISWQEFRNTFLATGMVDRLEVVNKDYVRIALRNTPNFAFFDLPNSGGGAGSSEEGGEFATDAVPADRELELHRALEEARAHRGLYFRIGSVEGFERQLEDAQLDLRVRPRDFVLVRHVSETSVPQRLFEAAPYLLTTAMFIAFMRAAGGGGVGVGGMNGGGKGGGGLGGGGGGFRQMFSIGKAKPAQYDKDSAVKVMFKDVAGCDEAKLEIMEFVQFLKDPSKFTALGAKIPTGALLVGPPGTGKTLLAKATAGEAGVPFFSMSGSDFIEMFVGVGPSRVRDLFAKAREAAPSIIFIDEIDAVARKRGSGKFSGGNDERENTLNQLLVEMDGFATTEGVLVLAGTNRVDILDKAILRPGRFDRQIMVDKPDIGGRLALFKLKMAGIKVAGDVASYAQRLAALTPGFVGADIANICNEAAIHAARNNGKVVTMKNFEAAIDRVVGGLEKRNSVMTADEKKTIAFHEAGHAIAGWFLEHADPLLKVTIIPRSGGALGFAQYLPKEVQLFTREALVDRMCMALGGRVAEELTFGRITTGASDDLDKVTQLAYALTTVYGMNPRVGQISFPRREEQQFDKPYSEATARVIDEEVKILVDMCYARTKELLALHADKLKKVADLLLERETISQVDLALLAGERPFPISAGIKEYLSAQFDDAEKVPPKESARKDVETPSEGDDVELPVAATKVV